VGDVYLLPYNLLGEKRDYLSCLGYCAQKCNLLDDLTGRQLLILYGTLRGITKEDLPRECQYWLAALGLENDADRPCKDYSGGMQRRLCVATALIGDPQVIMLDEPTSGVDPAGKRHLWNTLQRLQRIGKIVILASHNVQECEILCGRIGLLISGRMRYVDSTAEVKKMFLNGFTVCFRFKHSDKGESLFPIGDLKQEIENVLGECILREAHVTLLRYLVPQRGQNWGELLKKLEAIRTGLDGVESYSITDSSLEEVFHALAEMDADSSNVLSTNRVTCLQQCLMGKCCADDYA
jgi:ABC-type multidrug transport system ATPase subunit